MEFQGDLRPFEGHHDQISLAIHYTYLCYSLSEEIEHFQILLSVRGLRPNVHQFEDGVDKSLSLPEARGVAVASERKMPVTSSEHAVVSELIHARCLV